MIDTTTGVSASARTPGLGKWEKTGPQTYSATTLAFLFSPVGAWTGTQKLTHVIQASGSEITFTSAVEITDIAGNVTVKGCATAEGVRANGAAYPEQHKYALYREPQWWHHAPQVPDELPGCAEVNRTTVRLPLFTAEATEVIDQYAEAFEKIWAHREAVAKL